MRKLFAGLLLALALPIQAATLLYSGLFATDTSMNFTTWGEASSCIPATNCFTAWASDGPGDSYMRVTYASGAGDIYGRNYTFVPRNLEQVYIKFDNRHVFVSGGAVGPKRFKLFGQSACGTGGTQPCANTTSGFSGYGNAYDIYYGDVLTPNPPIPQNDNSVELNFYPSTPGSTNPLNYLTGGTSFASTPPTIAAHIASPITYDGNWHTWAYFIKFNSDGNADGQVIIWYDGAIIFQLNNVTNRAVGSPPLDDFGLGQYMNPIIGASVFYEDYRNVYVYDDVPAAGSITITPAPASVNFTGSIASLAITHNATITPAAAAVNFTGATAQLSVNGNIVIQPASAQIRFTGASARIVLSNQVNPTQPQRFRWGWGWGY